MCLFQVSLIHATIAPLLMPDCPTRISISVSMRFSHPPCYLQDRAEIADEVIHCSAPKPLYESRHSIVSTLTVQSDINQRATVASIKVLFPGINASIQPRFALSHAHALGILHYQMRYIALVFGNLPTSQLNATVRAAFMPDSTLESLPIFSSLKCTKSSIFSDFLHSWQWFGPQKLPRYFQA